MRLFSKPKTVQWKPALLYYGLWLALFAGIPALLQVKAWSDEVRLAVAGAGILLLFLPGVVVLLLAERGGRGPLSPAQPPRSQAELSAESEGMEEQALDVLQLILSFNAKYEQSPALKRTNELLLICMEERRQAVAAQKQQNRKLQ